MNILLWVLQVVCLEIVAGHVARDEKRRPSGVSRPD
jgi:hypothetical protein